MPVTSGQGNPNWTRDETILALSLYFRLRPSIPRESDPRVQKLSELLRKLNAHPLELRKASFRNGDSVTFKLQNLKAVETGTGLSNVSRMDRIVFEEFKDNPDRVHVLADSIVEASAALNDRSPPIEVDEDLEFPEGRILFRLHRQRERSRQLRQVVINRFKKLHVKLFCECCGQRGYEKLGADAEAIFEVHHCLPLSKVVESSTSPKDLAILCANCHRLIHRFSSKSGRWFSVSDFQRYLQGQ